MHCHATFNSIEPSSRHLPPRHASPLPNLTRQLTLHDIRLLRMTSSFATIASNSFSFHPYFHIQFLHSLNIMQALQAFTSFQTIMSPFFIANTLVVLQLHAHNRSSSSSSTDKSTHQCLFLQSMLKSEAITLLVNRCATQADGASRRRLQLSLIWFLHSSEFLVQPSSSSRKVVLLRSTLPLLLVLTLASKLFIFAFSNCPNASKINSPRGKCTLLVQPPNENFIIRTHATLTPN